MVSAAACASVGPRPTWAMSAWPLLLPSGAAGTGGRRAVGRLMLPIGALSAQEARLASLAASLGAEGCCCLFDGCLVAAAQLAPRLAATVALVCWASGAVNDAAGQRKASFCSAMVTPQADTAAPDGPASTGRPQTLLLACRDSFVVAALMPASATGDGSANSLWLDAACSAALEDLTAAAVRNSLREAQGRTGACSSYYTF